MRVLVFDLDFTLVDTSFCQDYLKTTAGREAILNKILRGEVKTNLYDSRIVGYINSLVEAYCLRNIDVLPIIVSDSPKSYCEAVLSQHGFKIDNDLIFGAAKKPCVDIDEISKKIILYTGEQPDSFLVIGDSTKDVFFAHEIDSPSIWTSWGYNPTEHMFPFLTAKPTEKAKNFDELKILIDRYVNSEKEDFGYEKPNFKEDWEIESVDLNDYSEHEVQEVGFVKHYVPEAFDTGDDEYISTFFEVHWMLKSAKSVPKKDLDRMIHQRFYTTKGEFTDARVLKRLAGVYKKYFTDWLSEKGITGNILLVPAPSSSPAECNKTHTVNLIAEWWSSWINGERNKYPHDFIIIYSGLCIERFQPKLPSHAKHGERFIEDQLSTMGAFKNVRDWLDNIDAVVFLDDVMTSGQTINAMATIFRELKVVPENVPLYGFVWYKTYHPTPDVDFSALILKADKVAADSQL